MILKLYWPETKNLIYLELSQQHATTICVEVRRKAKPLGAATQPRALADPGDRPHLNF